MNRTLYTLLYYLLVPFIFARLLLRSRKAPAYGLRWGERLGYFAEPNAKGGIWVHAVSVGETIAAAPLVEQLMTAYPELPVVITTMTPTGSDRVRSLLGDRVFHVYVPYDTPGAVKRFLSATRPKLALIVETELWPNLIQQCYRNGISTIIANARLSARSADGYARFPKLMGAMMRKITTIAAQNEEDGERFVALGLPRKRLQVTGSVKFDIQLPDSIKERALATKSSWGERKVWIAASTHEGEEELVLNAHCKLLESIPDLLLILVPRHPERFGEVAEIVRSRGLACALRSLNQPVVDSTQVLLGDTMGELLDHYSVADVAFVGGTLVDTGGHNFLEPAALGVPVVCGPHVFNFSEISRLLVEEKAMQKLRGAEQLEGAVLELLSDQKLADRMGDAGLAVVAANRGAQQRLFEIIVREIEEA